MKQVLACGEGPHDVGTTQWNSRTGSHVHLDGWLQPIIRKLADDATIRPKLLKQLIVTSRPSRLKPRPPGHADKAALAKFIAAAEGCTMLVFMTDADSADNTEHTRKIREIEDGFSLIDNDVTAIACVPKGTSESWLLCDEEAWSVVCGKRISGFPSCALAEKRWGHRNDPQGDHPKNTFARVSKAADLPDDRDTRQRVAEASELETLRTCCPISFSAFADAFT